MTAKILSPVSKMLFAFVFFFLALAGTHTRALDLSQVKREGKTNKTVSKDDEVVAVITRYDIKQDYLQQFRNALSNYVAKAMMDENNIMAEVYHEEDKPSVLWIIERWTSKAGQLAFYGSTAFGSVASLGKQALIKPAETIYVRDLEPLSKAEWRREAAGNDEPLTIMLFVDAKPGTATKFKDVYHVAMPQFRSEPGVINYQLSQFEHDSTQFVTYEKFRNEEAFQYHLKFPPIQPVIDYLNTDIKRQPFQAGLHRLIGFKSPRQQ